MALKLVRIGEHKASPYLHQLKRDDKARLDLT
jgi:hypothetical protein